MDKNIDSGKIIDQEVVRVLKSDDAGSLKKKIHQAVRIRPIHPKKSDKAPRKSEKIKKIKIKGYPELCIGVRNSL